MESALVHRKAYDAIFAGMAAAAAAWQNTDFDSPHAATGLDERCPAQAGARREV